MNRSRSAFFVTDFSLKALQHAMTGGPQSCVFTVLLYTANSAEHIVVTGRGAVLS